MTKEEKFKALVSIEKTDTLAKNTERIKNRNRLRESQAIAMKVLDKLDEPGWSQVRLAKEMGVSPQQITKIVSGKENLTLDTQVRLQEILNIPILATFYEKKFEEILLSVQTKMTQKYVPKSRISVNTKNEENIFRTLKKMVFNPQEKNYQQFQQTA
jgi:transcriptional regulator with XRE-family HTH domain